MAFEAKSKTRKSKGHNEAIKEVRTENQKRINISINESKHKAFKAKTANEGIKMTDYLIGCIDEYLSK